ncbi:MAG TPA: GntR family transcriptional regulator [Gemmatimonadaceae bacterium]|nr:GntR family transcriptional regulator [Gemmatimonadaceae bacterium]
MALPLPAAESARAPDAYRRIRYLIVRGRLAPATRVSEAELAARFGISRTPARQAMQRLLAEGLLVPAGGGARPRVAVAPVSASDVTELYEAAGALEGVAVRRISTLTPTVRRALHTELRARERAFRDAAAQRPLDYDLLFERHNAVHDGLTRACAGEATRALLDALRPRLDRYEWMYAPLIGPDFRATFREHSAILRALRDGDGKACERAVRANWFSGGERLARTLAAEEARS